MSSLSPARQRATASPGRLMICFMPWGHKGKSWRKKFICLKIAPRRSSYLASLIIPIRLTLLFKNLPMRECALFVRLTQSKIGLGSKYKKINFHTAGEENLKIFVTQPIPSAGLDVLRRAYPNFAMNPEERVLSRAELLAKINGCDAILSLLTDKMDG